MTTINHSADAVDLAVEVLQPIWDAPRDGFVAVMIWMPQRTSAALLERMEAETAAFVSKLHAAKESTF